jgi:hypothetical protein
MEMAGGHPADRTIGYARRVAKEKAPQLSGFAAGREATIGSSIPPPVLVGSRHVGSFERSPQDCQTGSRRLLRQTESPVQGTAGEFKGTQLP